MRQYFPEQAMIILKICHSKKSEIWICSCYRTVPRAIWEILSEFVIFCNLLTAKSEKRGKYLPILHEATCDNYFIVKCLSK